MRKVLLAILFICAFSRLGLAGFYLQAEFTSTSPSEEKTNKKGEEKKPVEPGILDIWIEGTRVKVQPGKEEIPWVIWEGEKEWFAVGFLLESQEGGKEKQKPQKVALTGTVDEVLKIIEDFLTQLKDLMTLVPNTQKEEVKKTLPPEESRKEKVKVSALIGERNIAGCLTRGIAVEVFEDEKKVNEVEIWFCPEISFEALLKPLISVQDKFKKFAQKWEKEFSSVNMYPQQELAETFTVEWREVMEKIQGIPFEVTVREKRGKDLERVSVYRVRKYQKKEFPAAFFTVPEDYLPISFAELLQRYSPAGNLPVLPGKK